MDMVKSRAAKFLTLEQVKQMAERWGAKMGDLLLIVAGKAGDSHAPFWVNCARKWAGV